MSRVQARSLLLIALACLLPACGDTADPRVRAEACPTSITGNGAEQKISHPEQPSQCKFVLLTCNACVYNREGHFLKVESELCGACIGTSF